MELQLTKISDFQTLPVLENTDWIPLIRYNSSLQAWLTYRFQLELLKGRDGKTSYEIALENGFSGTEVEWLASLQGPGGKSAYELAVQAGYQGTLEEWLNESAVAIDDLQTQIDALQTQLDGLKVYDPAGSWNGVPAVDTVILRHIISRRVRFEADFAGSNGWCGVQATAAADFLIKRWTPVEGLIDAGIMTYNPGSTGPTFSSVDNAPFTMEVGEVLIVVSPITADATLADLAFTFAGKRV